MTSEALLSLLDGLDYDARQRHVARLAKAQPSNLDALIDGLYEGDSYARGLAALMAYAGRRPQQLRRMLSDPSIRVRGRAAKFYAHVADEAALYEALEGLDSKARGIYIEALVRRERRGLLERYAADALAARDYTAATRVLVGLSEAGARRVLGEVEGRLIPWGRVGPRFPDLLLRWARTQLEGRGEWDVAHVWWLLQHTGALDALTLTRAEALMEDLEAYCPPREVPYGALQVIARLTRRFPARIAALLGAEARAVWLAQGGLPQGVLQELEHLAEPDLKILARRLESTPQHLTAMLLRLAPSRRAAIFEAAIEGVDTSKRRWPLSLLDALPHALRNREAERMEGLRAVQKTRRGRLEVIARQRLEVARPKLEEAASSSKAEDRAEAIALLIRCMILGREGVDEILERLLRLRNEQDPVRRAAWQALAEAPARLFEPQHIAPLTEMMTFTLEARDTSYATEGAIRGVAHKLLVGFAARAEDPLFLFGARILGRLAGQRPLIQLPTLSYNLPKRAGGPICAALLPWLKAASEADFHDNAIRLASALGELAWDQPALQALLEEAVRGKRKGVAQSAVTLWLANPETRDARVRQLLDLDESAITLWPVSAHLHRRRQSWLDPFLERRPIKGRFTSGKTLYLLPFQEGFHRWLPRQQRRYASHLTDLIIPNPKRSQAERVTYVHRLARMPALGIEGLEPYTRHEEVPIAEAALGALVWMEEPAEALPLLLDNLDGDRARVAMYAMPRLAKLIPQDQLLEALRGLLARPRLKITVQKEALRLLGTHRSEAALELLEATWRRPDLHRDVAIAALHAARARLDSERAWAILEAAPLSDPYVALALLEVSPFTIQPRYHARYLAILLRLAEHPDARAPEALFNLFAGYHPRIPSWPEGDPLACMRIAARGLLDFERHQAWPSAVNALIQLGVSAEARALILDTARQLLERARVEPTRVGEEEDLIAHQRLYALGRRALGSSVMGEEGRRALARDLGALLLGEIAFEPLAVTLALSGLLWRAHRQGVALLERLVALGAEGLAEALASAAGRGKEAKRAEPLMKALLAHANPQLRRLGLAILKEIGAGYHWQEGHRARLEALREDEDPRVRGEARRVWVFGA